jgi:hypothetical protein
MSEIFTEEKKIPASKAVIFMRLILAFFLGVAIFMTAQNWYLNRQIASLESRIEKSQDSLEKYKNLESIRAENRATEILEKAKNYRVVWSDYYKHLRSYESENISFDSVRSQNPPLFLVQARAQRLDQIITLLQRMEADPRITDPFVRNLNEDSDGTNRHYTFDLTFQLR